MPNSIDSDILNLMDEVNLDEFLRETVVAIDDPVKLSAYLREKATLAVERFLVRTTNVIIRKTHLKYTELPSKIVDTCRTKGFG
jgi:hypothetical protein